MEALRLPAPRLVKRTVNSIPLFTDDALYDASSVRIAFTGRDGGKSKGAYASLNLGSHVGDEIEDVLENRSTLLQAIGAEGMPLVVPNQVHGTDIVDIDSASAPAVAAAQEQATAGADALAVGAAGVAALLCFADCVPLIVVSPSGRFAVAHAGWRGAVSRIASKTVRRLCSLDERDLGANAPGPSGYNAYIGPHICARCFEVGEEVSSRFASEFGGSCVPDTRHVDLEAALVADFESVGVPACRVVSAGVCTKCSPDGFFSYRASGGVCGRHGALAYRS